MITWNLERQGPTGWRARLGAVAAVLQREAPDILCLQEAQPHQLADVRALLPTLQWIDGIPDAKGEHSAIGFDPRLYALEEGGGFPMPREAGATRRTATWARLRERRPGGTPMTVVNVHLDHESRRSRLLGAAYLRQRFPDAVLAGDFNAEPGSEPHHALLGTHQDPFPPDGAETMVGDNGTADARYDWILLPEGVEGAHPEVLRDAPSDHHALALDVRPRRVDDPT